MALEIPICDDDSKLSASSPGLGRSGLIRRRSVDARDCLRFQMEEKRRKKKLEQRAASFRFRPE